MSSAPLLDVRFEDLGPGRGYRLVSVIRHTVLDVQAERLPLESGGLNAARSHIIQGGK